MGLAPTLTNGAAVNQVNAVALLIVSLYVSACAYEPPGRDLWKAVRYNEQVSTTHTDHGHDLRR